MDECHLNSCTWVQKVIDAWKPRKLCLVRGEPSRENIVSRYRLSHTRGAISASVLFLLLGSKEKSYISYMQASKKDQMETLESLHSKVFIDIDLMRQAFKSNHQRQDESYPQSSRCQSPATYHTATCRCSTSSDFSTSWLPQPFFDRCDREVLTLRGESAHSRGLEMFKEGLTLST